MKIETQRLPRFLRRALISSSVLGVIFSSFVANANENTSVAEKKVFISIDSDAKDFTLSKFGKRAKEVQSLNGISIIKIDEEALPWVSMLMHKNFNRCGGFMVHDDEVDANNLINSSEDQFYGRNNLFADYSLNQEAVVNPMIAELSSVNLFNTISGLSNFQNRYYKGEFGKKSAEYIRSTWASLIKNRSDASVQFFAHSRWDQPSVILTIKGKSDEMIILGGHQDSINIRTGTGPTSKAPGADDNASGIAVITEVIRVLSDTSYQPQKTLKFMAYAAEEVGLLGSKEIATSFKNTNANVVGVMQLDMTNFKGDNTLDLVLMKDFTNGEQNKFIGQIIDKYVPGVQWGFDKCGYACSDHASWTTQGYPASMPFEATMRTMNKNIHSSNDTIEGSGNNTTQALKFAKMALAFVVELDL